ncbi:MAG: NTP transferase domain-containing protein [Chloroflexi bacterium]|nr:NTP transferase domain-containing protein [Chloroflexota bacterium]
MKAVILAAGEGKRMYPFTEVRPKVMVPVANRPIMEHLILELREAGIREFLLVVGYRSDKIREHFGDGAKWDISIEYATQKAQQGTADAVRQASGFVGDRFILVNGDVVVGSNDLRKLAERATPAMGICSCADVKGLGVVELRDGNIVRIHEKAERPPTNLVNTGLYLLTSDIFSAIQDTRPSPRGEYELTDSLQLLIERGIPLAGCEVKSWLNFTYPWDLLNANELLIRKAPAKVEGEVEEHVVLKGEVSVGKGTIISSGSYIVGPVVIGNDCTIGPNCFIRPATAIGDNCHIGAAVEVKNSIVMNRSNAPHLNYVGDSVIGEGCNLGAGCKTANLRLDKGNIKSMGVDTGRNKLGALIGDGVQTGINSCINIGCAIGAFSSIGPGALAHGRIKPRSVIL